MTAYAIRDKNTHQFIHDDNAPWFEGECADDDWYGFTNVAEHAKLYYTSGAAKRRMNAYLKECRTKNMQIDHGQLQLTRSFTRGSYIARDLEIVEVVIKVK